MPHIDLVVSYVLKNKAPIEHTERAHVKQQERSEPKYPMYDYWFWYTENYTVAYLLEPIQQLQPIVPRTHLGNHQL